MAFLDEVTIKAKAGRGGNGVVRWRHEKFIDRGGPNGGDGGRGGNVYIRAIRSLRVLDQYKAKKEYEAGRGEDGDSRSFKGANGEDIYLEFPIGSKVVNNATGESYELTKEKEEIKVLTGGAGGYGNEHFKSSTNVAPQEATPGKDGEEAEFFIEVSLIADVGLLGFPNAGKSSLLNALTNAQAKVGDYPFTTIDPNLGDLYGFIIADIPGLIEGASDGKGLGYKFLKHVSKTKVLLHLVSFENKDMMKIYETIREELQKYDDTLTKKDEIILLTKTDVVDEKTIKDTINKFEKLGKPVFAVTLFDDNAVKSFKDSLTKILENK